MNKKIKIMKMTNGKDMKINKKQIKNNKNKQFKNKNNKFNSNNRNQLDLKHYKISVI